MSQTRRTIYLGLMVGLAMGLHVFESMLPLPYLFPGAKLGLANIVSLYVIVTFGWREAVIVSLIRTILGSLLGGTLLNFTFFMSFSGGLVSVIMMGLAYQFLKNSLSLVGISIVGALSHNITQVLVASYMVRTIGIFFYLPHLLFFALPTGFFVGLVVNQMLRHTSLS